VTIHTNHNDRQVVRLKLVYNLCNYATFPNARRRRGPHGLRKTTPRYRLDDSICLDTGNTTSVYQVIINGFDVRAISLGHFFLYGRVERPVTSRVPLAVEKIPNGIGSEFTAEAVEDEISEQKPYILSREGAEVWSLDEKADQLMHLSLEGCFVDDHHPDPAELFESTCPGSRDRN